MDIRGLPGPYMIKLDTHGYEVPIRLGAKETLRNANLAVIETYNFRIQGSSLLFHEMVAHMRDAAGLDFDHESHGQTSQGRASY
jgi:hypothetical protein